MENCNLVHDNMFGYLEKKLPHQLMQQIEVHVNTCAECARLAAEFRGVMILMEEQKTIVPKPFAETRIFQAVITRLEKKEKPLTLVFTRILQPVIISVSIMVAMGIGFLIGSDFANTNKQNSQNEVMTEAVRTDLNVPDFMTDNIFYFAE